MESRENNGPYNIWAEAETTIEFYDCDPMRVVWHGNYINYFEIGRRTLLEKLELNYNNMEEFGFAFPVIEISAKYLEPLRFRDRVLIKAILLEYEYRLKIKYEIRNIQSGFLTTKGVSTQMAYDIKAGESCFVCPVGFVKKIEAFIGKKNYKG